MKYLMLLAMVLMGSPVNSQTFDPIPGKSKYINLNMGLGLNRLRDYATSPLFYEGIALGYSASLASIRTHKEISTGFSFLNGRLKNDFNDHKAVSSLTSITVHHTRLYQIFRNSPPRWNIKVGGEARILANVRVNQTLMNNALGIEAFPILFGSIRSTWNITRNKTNGSREPKQRSLALSINPGLLGYSLRNGYSYLGISSTINDPGIAGILKDYSVQPFGVTSVNTSLDYTIWLKNKNGWKFSYAWEAYKTRKDFSTFEMASHSLRVAILFNTKNSN
jgi:hypothetical protein